MEKSTSAGPGAGTSVIAHDNNVNNADVDANNSDAELLGRYFLLLSMEYCFSRLVEDSL